MNRFGKVLASRLSAQSVALIVKRWALEAGFDPMLFAGHSLRSGLRNSRRKSWQKRALHHEANRPPLGHSRTPLYPDAELFEDNAAAGIGL